MSKLITSKDSNGIRNQLVLQEGDLAVLECLRDKRSGNVPLTISAASVDGDVVFVTQKGRIYELQRRDVFR